MAVISDITGEYLQEIKSALGFPLINHFDWGVNTDDYVRGNVVSRVLRKYFIYFPLIVNKVSGISDNFEISYPADTNIYRMFRHFFDYKSFIAGNLSNPFYLQSQVIDRRTQPFLRPYHLNEVFGRLATSESITDYAHALHIEDFPNERKVKGSTTTAGFLSIQWAKRSTNFGDVTFTHLDDAIKLAKAYLLQDAARLRDSIKLANSKIDIDINKIAADGEKWEDEVMNRWSRKGFGIVVK